MIEELLKTPRVGVDTGVVGIPARIIGYEAIPEIPMPPKYSSVYLLWANNLNTKLEPRLPGGNEVTVKLVKDGLFYKSAYYISVFVNPDPSPASL